MAFFVVPNKKLLSIFYFIVSQLLSQFFLSYTILNSFENCNKSNKGGYYYSGCCIDNCRINETCAVYIGGSGDGFCSNDPTNQLAKLDGTCCDDLTEWCLKSTLIMILGFGGCGVLLLSLLPLRFNYKGHRLFLYISMLFTLCSSIINFIYGRYGSCAGYSDYGVGPLTLSSFGCLSLFVEGVSSDNEVINDTELSVNEKRLNVAIYQNE